MRTFPIILAICCMSLMPVLALAGNSSPKIYLEIYQYDTEPDDPTNGCLAHGTCPEILGHTHPVPWPGIQLQCYSAKLPYYSGIVAIHIGRLDYPIAQGWPLPSGPGGGYVAVSTGITTSGDPCWYVGHTACPGWLAGPCSNPPFDMMFAATSACHDWFDHPGYVKWINWSTSTAASFFDITGNAVEGGLTTIINCQNGSEFPAIAGRAQWGGVQTITCPVDTVFMPVCSVTPVSIDFGSVLLGGAKNTTFTITNTGEGTLTGSVSEDCSDYSIVSGGGSYSLGHSESRVVTVRFEPSSEGTRTCVIETGNGLCSDVSCTGIGVLDRNQEYPGVAFDGTNYFVVWQDHRGGTTWDIYGARVNQAGVMLDAGGIVISAATSDQVFPAVAFDGANYLVVWEDHRNGTGNWDIYGARVDKSGNVLDPSGIAICAATSNQNTPAIAFDATNYLVAWSDRRGASWDIYGTRVSTAGSVLDPGGIAISTAAQYQTTPAVAFDGTNYLVVWGDYRSGSNYDIYGCRVSTIGGVLDPAGVAICTAANHQADPWIASDGTDYLVVWDDMRSGSGTTDVYGARVNAGGAVLDPSGIVISAATINQVYPHVAFDGTDYLVVWQDNRRASNYDIFGARVTPSGVLLDASGFPVATSSTDQKSPCVQMGPVAQALVAYQSFNGSPYNCYLIADSLIAGTVAVEEKTVPAAFNACHSYPNPFNPSCTIQYDMPRAGKVTIRVFAVGGMIARTLVDAWREPAVYREVWDGKADDGTALPSGVYIYSLKAGDFVATRKMVLLR